MVPDEKMVGFGRALRAAGLPTGPQRMVLALAAARLLGSDRPADLRAALCAVLTDRREHRPLFDAIYDAFWDNALDGGPARAALKPAGGPGLPSAGASPKAALEHAWPSASLQDSRAAGAPGVTADAALAASARERSSRADVESMTDAEFAAVLQRAAQAPLPVAEVARRRRDAAARGRIDLRRTLARMARRPQTLEPVFTRARQEPPPLVVLLDVSRSMGRYALLFVSYAQGLVRRHVRLQAFAFGTRLTCISHLLRGHDPVEVRRRVQSLVPDWRGGTRLARALDSFNRLWAGRVLGRDATVLLVTDGLDGDPRGELDRAAAQLRRRAREVIWLNPLLGFQGFEPRAAGIRALLPHVDRFLPVHSLDSLESLAAAMRSARPRSGFDVATHRGVASHRAAR
jgi:uncharacterized protein with von Willebrand factor type A (vWA) domain